ncbi:MAG: DNA polymerase III subunit delta [Anaerolineae bacterium]|nr:DNA polymerase III subunit delta [Thermoflexales bacterium]MDW8408140.1 DNA polymerase III subunit delta [Anaerolineae bacterium]
MWYVFHGPDGLTRDEEIARMKRKLGEPDVAGLNYIALDATAPLKDIQAAADALPFLTDKRLVVVRNWLAQAGRGRRKSKAGEADDVLSALIAYLPSLPETTGLVFAEDEALPATHPLIKLAQDKLARGFVKLFDLPEDATRWIAARAKSKGGEISRPAAQLLSTKIHRGNKNDRDHFVEDSQLYLRKLDAELDKLVAYAAGRRIEESDVEALVSDEQVADMFGFVDAIGARDGAAALRILRGVLARGEQPLIVLTMIARQTRLLIQAKENDHLTPSELAQALGLHPFVAEKVARQARNFSMARLEGAHIAVMETDLAIKTGRMEDGVALDTLVAELCVV